MKYILVPRTPVQQDLLVSGEAARWVLADSVEIGELLNPAE